LIEKEGSAVKEQAQIQEWQFPLLMMHKVEELAVLKAFQKRRGLFSPRERGIFVGRLGRDGPSPQFFSAKQNKIQSWSPHRVALSIEYKSKFKTTQ